MQRPQHPKAQGDVLTPTEARQASPRKMNFRVLLASMALAVAIGAVLVAGFWHKTPPNMDASSGGNPSQNTGTAPPPQTPANP